GQAAYAAAVLITPLEHEVLGGRPAHDGVGVIEQHGSDVHGLAGDGVGLFKLVADSGGSGACHEQGGQQGEDAGLQKRRMSHGLHSIRLVIGTKENVASAEMVQATYCKSVVKLLIH